MQNGTIAPPCVTAPTDFITLSEEAASGVGQPDLKSYEQGHDFLLKTFARAPKRKLFRNFPGKGCWRRLFRENIRFPRVK